MTLFYGWNVQSRTIPPDVQGWNYDLNITAGKHGLKHVPRLQIHYFNTQLSVLNRPHKVQITWSRLQHLRTMIKKKLHVIYILSYKRVLILTNWGEINIAIHKLEKSLLFTTFRENIFSQLINFNA